MEFVFVVAREEIFPECTPHGLELFNESLPTGDSPAEGARSEADFRNTLERAGFFVEREFAERTPAFKQVIPYTLVMRRTDVGLPEVFRLRRTRAGGEARLHDKLSIGVGGHIEPVDLPGAQGQPSLEVLTPHTPADGPAPRSLRDPIPGATRREVLEEELEVEGAWRLHSLGLINDDTNPVGAVHVGLVQILEVEGAVRVRETEQLEGLFVPLAELQEELSSGANFETWSSLIIPHLGDVLATGSSAYPNPSSVVRS
ncbi:MAG: putative NUDIX family phosphoesterase [Planctomycetota bacterium]|jgi:predicted NUDIX family phosphoesterase